MQKLSNEIATIINSRSFESQTFSAMTEICSHTLAKLGFSAFEYARVYDNQTALILYSDPKIANYVVQKQLHISAHVPREIINSEFWYIPDPYGAYSQNVREVKEISGSSSFSNYIRRYPGYYEMFCFWSLTEQSSVTNKFINMKESLEQYCSSFVETAKNLILFVEQDCFMLTDAMQPNFHGLKSEELINSKNLQICLEKFQRELIKLGSYISPKLSRQELNCILFLIQGKTGPDIADLLKLSHRTVEMHLNSIKIKLGCHKKSEIISTLIGCVANFKSC